VRLPLEHKRFGLFECVRAGNHHFMNGVPDRFRVAHSRWNELPLNALAACGYGILTRSVEAGVDTFVRQRKSTALFFQGHPEYDAGALLREYRRDVRRFLRGERESYPDMPRGYFDRAAAAELAAFRLRAIADRREDLLAEFPSSVTEAKLTPNRDSPAALIYGNWLTYLSAQKGKRGMPGDGAWQARSTVAALAGERVS
jgi:homoserine O-succinyltransferase